MPAHRKPRLLPDVKPCEQCGQPFHRPAKYADSFWIKKRFCSLSCASTYGHAMRERVSVEERFWSAIDKSPGQGPNGDCWEWTLGRLEWGYGRFAVGRGEVKAHRMAYELAVGPVPDGLMVCHHCDNPPCCNPSHLFVGDGFDNMGDMAAKGRSLQGVKHHKAKLSDDDVRAIRVDTRRQVEIAEEYGVSRGLVGHIKRRLIWKHIE